MKTKILCVMLALISLLGACTEETLQQEDGMTSRIAQEEQGNNDVTVEILDEPIHKDNTVVSEEVLYYELETLLPENAIGEIYYWVFLQNGRKLVNQKDVQKVNDRLHELGVESSIGFHIITIEEYVTPEVLIRVYEDLGGHMDFVSIGSGLCGFYMDEWEEEFIDLSEELKNGQLQQFYTTVPEIVWEANQINNKMLSFANSMTVSVPGYAFYKEDIEKCDVENLMKIKEANGVENEEIWIEVCEDVGGGLFKWSKVIGGRPITIAENRYERNTLSRIANSYEELYYVYLTDDIRYCIETQEYEWLPESEKYREVKKTVESLYKKGYIGNVLNGKSCSGFVATGNMTADVEMVHNTGDFLDSLWIPFWQEARVSKCTLTSNYMYSFVYKEAEDGWADILRCLGTDEEICTILNQDYADVIISAVVYENWDDTVFVGEMDTQYEMVKNVYEMALSDPTEGFIFNPIPIQEEWEEYNELMSSYAGIALVVTDGVELVPQLDIIDTIWMGYLDSKEEAHIDLVLEEINRQYTEWKKFKSRIE